MSHSQTLNVEEVPWLVPDDGNDYSYDTSVELSFFESSPPTQLQPRRPAPNAPGLQRGYSTDGHVPIRPLDLKRREGSSHNQRTMTSVFPNVMRSVSDNAIPQNQHTRSPPRASVTPVSPSIFTRSSNSHSPYTFSLNNPSQARSGDSIPHQQPVKKPFSNRLPSMGTSNHLPLRSTSAPPASHLSPTERHIGLGQFVEDIQYLGFSPASIGSPSDSDSGMSRDYHVGEDWVEVNAPMTPSRAGAKALQVLGGCAQVNKPGRNPFKKTKKDSYRPVPNAVIKELDAFFGVPAVNAKPNSRKTNLRQTSLMGSIVDSHGQVWENETEREEFSSLLSEHQLEQQNRKTLRDSTNMVLLSPIRLHSKQSMDALRSKRDSDSTLESDEDVFGRLGPLLIPSYGISCDDLKTKERIIYNRQQSHPPPSTMSFLQSDPYAGTQRRHTSPRNQPVAIKRKEPPPPLTLDSRSPSTVKQVMIEQIVSGRPRLSSVQVPVRKSSRAPALVRSVTDTPYTPFSAPRPAPIPPAPPMAPRRVTLNPLPHGNHFTRYDSGPKTPQTPSPEQPAVSQFLTRIQSIPDDHPEERPMLLQGVSFFEDSPPPDHTHFKFAPSKATMRDVSGRIRKAVRL